MGSKDYLFPYQKSWVLNEHRYSIYEKSRRIGISFAEALWSVRKRIQRKADHFFVSANLNTSKEFIRYCKLWAGIFNVIIKDDRWIDLDGATSEMLVFPNGSRIVCLSSNPTALRGQGGDVTLDEFAFHDAAEELYTAAQPVITWGFQLRIISTHNGVGTLFYRLIQEAKSGKNDFKLYKTTLLDAVNEGLAEKIGGDHHKEADPRASFVDGIRRNCTSIEAFQQEYLCEVAETTTVVSAQEYDQCILPSAKIIPSELKEATYGTLYVGVDIGRSQNLTVIWVVEHGIDKTAPRNLQDCYRTVAIRKLDGVPFANQTEIIEQYVSHPKVHRAIIDAGGIGMSIAEHLVDKFGNRVEGVHIGLPLKAELVERFKKFVAQRRLSLPDDALIKEDVLCMRRTSTRTGKLSYDGSTKTTHADFLIAAALALKAADTAVDFTWFHKR